MVSGDAHDLDKRLYALEKLYEESIARLKQEDEKQWKEIDYITKNIRDTTDLIYDKTSHKISEARKFLISIISLTTSVLVIAITLMKFLS